MPDGRMWSDLAEHIGAGWLLLAIGVAAAGVLIGFWLLATTGIRQGEFVLAALVNATEQALTTEYLAQFRPPPGTTRSTNRGLGSVERNLWYDTVLAVSVGALLVLVAMRLGLAVDARWQRWTDALAWVGVAFTLADLGENTSFLVVTRRFAAEIAVDRRTSVKWVWANLSLTFSTIKLTAMVVYAAGLAVVGVATFGDVRWPLGVAVGGLALPLAALANLREPHRRWIVHVPQPSRRPADRTG